jgi:hypothetical protein
VPTPALVSSIRFTDQANTKLYFLRSIAAVSLTPTRAEMTNGIDVSGELNDWAGWTVDAQMFDTQNLNTPYQTQAPGILTSPPSSVTLYTSKTGVDARSVLIPGTTWFAMFCDGGDIGGNRAEVYPVVVAAIGVLRSMPSTTGGTSGSGSSTQYPSKVKFNFAITAAPAQAVIVPT